MGRMEDFVKSNRITEIECLIPDMSGIARGKIVPAEKFLRILRDRGLRLPEAIFVQTVTGEFPEDEDVTSDENSDVTWFRTSGRCVSFPGTPSRRRK